MLKLGDQKPMKIETEFPHYKGTNSKLTNEYFNTMMINNN